MLVLIIAERVVILGQRLEILERYRFVVFLIVGHRTGTVAWPVSLSLHDQQQQRTDEGQQRYNDP